MAYVVRRPHDRWEIRESFASPAGPRSRTLASFTTLTTEILDRAVEMARGPIDRETLRRVAKRAGVPSAPSKADGAAVALVQALARGAELRPGLRTILEAALAGRPHDSDALVQWLGAPLSRRSAALIDLLDLADQLPHPRRRPLTFPGLSPERLRR